MLVVSHYLPTCGGTINGALTCNRELTCNDDLYVNGHTDLESVAIYGSFGIENDVQFSGGHVSGVGLKVTQYSGGSSSSQSTLISKFDNVVLLMTNGYYRLPEMDVNDDGHLIMIKRLAGGGTDHNVHVMWNNGWHNGNTVSLAPMLVDRGLCGGDIEFQTYMDARTFIYCRDLSMNGYQGVWVEWKNPRDW